MSTVANVRSSAGSRFYTKDGQAVWEIPKKSGKGMKKPNINDAIDMDLVPSVTTVLKTIHKPGLQDWLIEQAVLAVLTTPRMTGERDDEFVNRVLKVDRVQDETADKAADLGTDIHDAIDKAVKKEAYDSKFDPYVFPVLDILQLMGRRAWSEKVLVGEGYAGRADYCGEDDAFVTVVDFKTTGKPPEKAPWDEHLMQVAAYAKSIGNTADKHIRTAVIYISTATPGQIVSHVQENWLRHYEQGFKPCLELWRYLNGVS